MPSKRWLTAALAKGREDFKRIAPQNMHSVVLAISEVDIGLLRVLRKGNVPGRSRTERHFRNECFLYERAIGFEHLEAVIRAVADV